MYIAASIDGFIATSDGGIDWLHAEPSPSNTDYGYSEFIERIDAVLMGRNSFEKVRSFDNWPYEKKVFVATSTLEEIPDELRGKVEFISGDPPSLVATIREKGFNNLYIDGGQLIQSFLSHDMIDELIVTRIPILLGGGIPLFGDLVEPIKLKHIDTTVYDNALVKSHYSKVGVTPDNRSQ